MPMKYENTMPNVYLMRFAHFTVSENCSDGKAQKTLRGEQEEFDNVLPASMFQK